MRIWINTPFDTVPSEGGRPMRYWLLCRALVAEGHEVVLWSSDFHHVTKSRRQLEPVYEADGFQVRLIPTRPYRSNIGLQRVLSHRRYARHWWRQARAAVAAGELRPPEGVVVSLPPLGLFRAAARMRRRWGCPVVVDIQDAWPETFYRLLPRCMRWLAPLLLWPARRQARKAYRQADGVTVVAETYQELARAYGCRAPMACFRLATPLPPATADFKSAAPSLKLCYVGNLGDGYDLDTLIEAVRQLAEDGVPVTLTVAGDGPQRGRFIAAGQQGVPIDFRGYLDDKAMQACQAGCDIGVVPMFPESWVAVPNKLIDYAAAGLAIINGLKGGTQALLDNHAAGLAYETGSAASLTAAVKRYHEDRDLLARHRQAARRLAETDFDAARIYPAMARWLTQLVLKTYSAHRKL